MPRYFPPVSCCTPCGARSTGGNDLYSRTPDLAFTSSGLAVLTAINLQTSFLHPPFGFALFFMRGVAPKSISTGDIYWGAVPFICVQIIVLAMVWLEPRIVTAIPEHWNGAPIAAPAPASTPSIRHFVIPGPPDAGPGTH